MDAKLIALYKRIKETYQESIDLLEDIRRDVRNCRNLEELADSAYALNEANKLVSDLGLECRRILGLSEKLANLICLQTDVEGPIRTEYVTASLRQKMSPTVPPRDSAEYGELCRWLDINPDSQDMVRIHQPTLKEAITKAIEEGSSVPPVAKMEAEFHLTLRKRKEVA